MGFQFQGLSSNVTISGSVATGIPQLTTGQTLVNISTTGTGSVATAYTVTTGKSLMLYSGMMQGSETKIYKTDGTSLVGYFGSGGAAPSTFSSMVPIWIYTSGQLVKINATNGAPVVLVGVEYTP